MEEKGIRERDHPDDSLDDFADILDFLDESSEQPNSYFQQILRASAHEELQVLDPGEVETYLNQVESRGDLAAAPPATRQLSHRTIPDEAGACVERLETKSDPGTLITGQPSTTDSIHYKTDDASSTSQQTVEVEPCASKRKESETKDDDAAGSRLTPTPRKKILYSIAMDDSTEARLRAEYYDFKCWYRFKDPPFTRKCMGVTAYQNKVWVVGGFPASPSHRDACGEVNIYDPETDEWQTILEELGTKRGGLSVAVAGGKLYAVGGSNGRKTLSVVEAYTDRTGWVECEQMKDPREYFGVAVVGNDKLVALGGRKEKNVVPSMEQYSCETNSWTYLNQTRRGMKMRCYFSFVCVGETLYAVGGDTRSTISYHNENGTWVKAARLGRRSCTAIAVDGLIYLVGGCASHSHSCPITTVDCFDPKTGAFHQSLGKMKYPKMLPGLALVNM